MKYKSSVCVCPCICVCICLYLYICVLRFLISVKYICIYIYVCDICMYVTRLFYTSSSEEKQHPNHFFFLEQIFFLNKSWEYTNFTNKIPFLIHIMLINNSSHKISQSTCESYLWSDTYFGVCVSSYVY